MEDWLDVNALFKDHPELQPVTPTARGVNPLMQQLLAPPASGGQQPDVANLLRQASSDSETFGG